MAPFLVCADFQPKGCSCLSTCRFSVTLKIKPFASDVMCLILIAYQLDPAWPLVVLDNRDEYYARSTAPLGLWPGAPDVLAGRDLQSGGSWMGLRRDGCWAAVTNYREPRNDDHARKSRGWLVRDFLLSSWSVAEYIERVVGHGEDYAGYNLLLGDRDGIWFVSNRDPEVHQLAPGLYGLSNGRFDAPWPKVTRAKQKIAGLLDRQNWQPEEALELMCDATRAADADLPATGVPLDWERALSSMFILTPKYGTRSTSQLMRDREGDMIFAERTYSKAPDHWHDTRFSWQAFLDEKTQE